MIHGAPLHVCRAGRGPTVIRRRTTEGSTSCRAATSERTSSFRSRRSPSQFAAIRRREPHATKYAPDRPPVPTANIRLDSRRNNAGMRRLRRELGLRKTREGHRALPAPEKSERYVQSLTRRPIVMPPSNVCVPIIDKDVSGIWRLMGGARFKTRIPKDNAYWFRDVAARNSLAVPPGYPPHAASS